VIASLRELLVSFADQIETWSDTPTMAFTHIQPAEPTTIGYRLAQYGQDLLIDFEELTRVRAAVRGKGFKGAVGTSASYKHLLEGRSLTPAEFEARIMAAIGLEAFPVATQTYTRKQDWLIAAAIGSLASSLYKFAFDLRVLQTPPIGEWSEPFGSAQVGSSAMPFKRNPVNAEKVDSLGRLIGRLIGVLWDNASHSILERTLDDSANRREVFPVLFLGIDEMLRVSRRLISGLKIDRAAVASTLERYGTFAAIERLLMELVKMGASRQDMHQRLRDHSMAAWNAIARGADNPLVHDLSHDPDIVAYLPTERVAALLDGADYVGDAPERARALARAIRLQLAQGV